jgi:hypothetical protein
LGTGARTAAILSVARDRRRLEPFDGNNKEIDMGRGPRYAIGAVIAALAFSCGQGFAQTATGEFERTVNVTEPVALDVTTGSGSITITRGAGGEVMVRGSIRVRAGGERSAAEAEALARRLETEPPIEVTGSSVRVGHLDEEDRRNVSISYAIEVPAATSVISRTGSGDQSVAELDGAVDARTGSGAITLTDIEGAVEVSTGSGDIVAERIAGAFDGSTGSGSIDLVQTASGAVAVATGSGSVTLKGVENAARARTGSGRVAIDGVPGGPWDVETGSGSVHLRVPADAAFSLDLRTSSGAVETSHAVTMVGSIPRGTLRGDVRGGGSLVHVRTGSGSIRVE